MIDWSAVLIALIGAFVAIVEVRNGKSRKKREKVVDERYEFTKELQLLMLEGIDAVGHLGEGTALAVQNGKANGELEDGLRVYKNHKKKKREFYRNAAVDHAIEEQKE